MTPRDYQLPGIKKLYEAICKHGTALDMSDTGTGKTYKALFVAKKACGKIYVICPLGVVENWKKAATAVGVEILCVTNYDKARIPISPGITRKGKRFEFNLEYFRGTLLIFDEVHRCQSPKSRQSRLLVDAKRHRLPILMLSATPFETPLQLRAIGYALDLFDVGDHWHWCLASARCKPAYFGGLEYKGGPEFMRQLRTQIEDRIDRVRVADLDWQAINTQTVWIAPEDRHAVDEAYETMLRKAQEKAWNPLTHNLRERQIIEHQKIKALADLAEVELDAGQHVIIFCNFRDTLDQLQQLLKAHCPSIVHGDITGVVRESEINTFQQGDTHLILVMIQAGGEGISLHDLEGGRPRTALVNLTYSSRQFIQAIGRPHRDGGMSPVTIKIPLAVGTIEESIDAKLTVKLNNLKALTDGDLMPV